MEELIAFIQGNPDPRELKRARFGTDGDAKLYSFSGRRHFAGICRVCKQMEICLFGGWYCRIEAEA